MAETILDYAICTLAEVKLWLGIDTDDTGDDELITELINVVTNAIEDYLDRRVIVRSTAITEYFSGDGSSECYVKHPPIAELDSIYIEDVVTLDSTDCADTDQVRYNPTTGYIALLQYYFSAGYPRNCYRKYKGGWYKKGNTDGDGGAEATPVVPLAIWQGCREEVKRLYKYKDRQETNISSKSYGVTGETIAYFQDKGLSEETKTKIDRWHMVRVDDED